MTQMGLEYMKLKETARHNVNDEGIRNRQTDVSQIEADTHKYVASFKPQEVGIQQQQADSSTSQAGTAQGRLELDSAYRERETQAKEDSASAAKIQAAVANSRLALDSSYRERETVAKEMQSKASESQALTASQRQIVDEYLGNLKNLSPELAAQQSAEKLGFSSTEQYLAAISKLLSTVNLSLSIKP